VRLHIHPTARPHAQRRARGMYLTASPPPPSIRWCFCLSDFSLGSPVCARNTYLGIKCGTWLLEERSAPGYYGQNGALWSAFSARPLSKRLPRAASTAQWSTSPPAHQGPELRTAVRGRKPRRPSSPPPLQGPAYFPPTQCDDQTCACAGSSVLGALRCASQLRRCFVELGYFR